MLHMRTIDQTMEHIRATDPETALTKTALRRMVVSGRIPSVRVGPKYLIALENLDAYLRAAESGAEPEGPERRGEIRRIDGRPDR